MTALTHILACATCGFDRTGQVGAAAEGSILFLLGTIFFMFGIFGYVIFSFARNARRAAAFDVASNAPAS